MRSARANILRKDTKLHSETLNIENSYNSIKENADLNYKEWRNPIRPRIDVAMDTSSLANGAVEIERQLEVQESKRKS